MKRLVLGLLVVVAGCGGSALDGLDSSSSALDSIDGRGQPENPALGVHWARGEAGAANKHGGGGSPDLVWHNGAILTSSTVTAIFWGNSWATASFVGDKISGLDQFYGGVGGSKYMGTNTEYTGTNGQVGSGVTYSGHLIDTGSGLTHAPKTSDIQAEVCKMIINPV